MMLTEKELKKITTETMQSVRNLEHNGVMYAIYITNRFRKIGWMAEIDEKFYGASTKLSLQQKDDIIDYYLTMDKNAKDTIEELCKK